jgi:hypothetical protein
MGVSNGLSALSAISPIEDRSALANLDEADKTSRDIWIERCEQKVSKPAAASERALGTREIGEFAPVLLDTLRPEEGTLSKPNA